MSGFNAKGLHSGTGDDKSFRPTVSSGTHHFHYKAGFAAPTSLMMYLSWPAARITDSVPSIRRDILHIVGRVLPQPKWWFQSFKVVMFCFAFRTWRCVVSHVSIDATLKASTPRSRNVRWSFALTRYSARKHDMSYKRKTTGGK